MTRIPYLDKEDLAPEHRDLLDRPINLNRAMVHSPVGRRALQGVGQFIRYGSKLDPRLREMAILQVGYITRSAYEWSHHVKIGYDFGVSDEDIRAIVAAAEDRSTGLDELTEAVLRAAREMATDIRISEDTFAVLSRHMNNELLTDLVTTIAYYNAVVRILAALEIDVEHEYAPYLEQFPLPSP